MTYEIIRKLLTRYIEESEVDEETTESILKRILRILFPNKKDAKRTEASGKSDPD